MTSLILPVILIISVLFQNSNGWIFNNVNFEMIDPEAVIKNHYRDILNNDIDVDDVALQRFSLIYPGTKWCGAGNVADDYDDLGPAKDTDTCCRDHDNCADVMEAGETKHNLTNNAFYSRLSCNCDEAFRQCLRAVNGTISKQIGVIYFNALGTKCYRKDYPIVKCKKHGGWFNRKCLDYELDTSGDQSYQWFDVSNF